MLVFATKSITGQRYVQSSKAGKWTQISTLVLDHMADVVFSTKCIIRSKICYKAGKSTQHICTAFGSHDYLH